MTVAGRAVVLTERNVVVNDVDFYGLTSEQPDVIRITPAGMAHARVFNPEADSLRIESYRLPKKLDNLHWLRLDDRCLLDKADIDSTELHDWFDLTGITDYTKHPILSIVHAKGVGMTPEYAREYNLRGYCELGLSRRMWLHIQGVTPDSLESFFVSNFSPEGNSWIHSDQETIDDIGMDMLQYGSQVSAFTEYPHAWDWDSRKEALSDNVSASTARAWARHDKNISVGDVLAYARAGKKPGFELRYPGWDSDSKLFFDKEGIQQERVSCLKAIADSYEVPIDKYSIVDVSNSIDSGEYDITDFEVFLRMRAISADMPKSTDMSINVQTPRQHMNVPEPRTGSCDGGYCHMPQTFQM
jgi:hypothetical protein